MKIIKWFLLKYYNPITKIFAKIIFCNIVENMELWEQIKTIYILEQYGYQ